MLMDISGNANECCGCSQGDLVDFGTHTKVKSNNVVFNESMVHKKPIMEVNVRKVVSLKDVITYTLCSREVGNFH